jgi:small subunit ribosomal protein S6
LKTVAKNVYEAMFLVDSAVAASDWEGINSFIKSILEKAEAQIISIRKWDERKLTYDIDKKSRGTYILCYFTAPTLKISQIERDIRLSERIMRVLILRGEHLTKEDMEKETPLMIAQREGTVGQAEPERSSRPDNLAAEEAPRRNAADIEVKKIEDSPEPDASL